MPHEKYEKAVTDLAQNPKANLVWVPSKLTASKEPAYYRRCCNAWLPTLGNFCTKAAGHEGDHYISPTEPWSHKPLGELVWSIKAVRENGNPGAFFRRACNTDFDPKEVKYGSWICTLPKGHDGPHMTTDTDPCYTEGQ